VRVHVAFVVIACDVGVHRFGITVGNVPPELAVALFDLLQARRSNDSRIAELRADVRAIDAGNKADALAPTFPFARYFTQGADELRNILIARR
jgi:RNase H-fold protein (predicted Holliday junction resolvase)